MKVSLRTFSELTSVIVPLGTDETGVLNMREGILGTLQPGDSNRPNSLDSMPPFPEDFPQLAATFLSREVTKCQTVIVKRKNPETVWMMHVSPSSMLSEEKQQTFFSTNQGKTQPYKDLSLDYPEEGQRGQLTLNKNDEVDIGIIVDTPSIVDEEKLAEQLGCKINKISIICPPPEIKVEDQGGSYMITDFSEKTEIISRNYAYNVAYLVAIDALLVIGENEKDEVAYYLIDNYLDKITKDKQLDYKPFPYTMQSLKKICAQTGITLLESAVFAKYSEELENKHDLKIKK